MDRLIQIMNKNGVMTERSKLKGQIKELSKKYDALVRAEEEGRVICMNQEEQMFEVVNSIAMRYAQQGFVQRAEQWLMKAEPLVNNNDKFAVIFNSNLACVCKNKDDLTKALKHLKQSQTTLQKMRSHSQPSKRLDRMLIDCWLNMAALFSSKKMHYEALENISNAQLLIMSNLKKGFEKFIDQYVIARYNQAIELQHLGRVDQAYDCLDGLKKFMYDERIYGHFLEKKINEVILDIRKKIIRRNSKKKTLNFTLSLKKIPQQEVELKDVINHTRKTSLVSHRDQPQKKTDRKILKIIDSHIKKQSLSNTKQNNFIPLLAPLSLQPRPLKSHRTSRHTPITEIFPN